MKKTNRLFTTLCVAVIAMLVSTLSGLAQTTDNYSENFESHGLGPITNVSGWTATETNSVIASTNYTADYVGGDYPLTYDHTVNTQVLQIENGVTNTITPGTSSITNWVDVVIKPVVADDTPDLPPAGTMAAVWFNTNMHPVILHSPSNDANYAEWLEIPDVTITEGKWIRLTIQVNVNTPFSDPGFTYFNGTSFHKIYINGTAITNAAAYDNPWRDPATTGGEWFGSYAAQTKNSISNVMVKGTGYLDDLVVTNSLMLTAPTTWTITASAGANGSISPSGSVVVTEGNDKSFTITPDSGYVIDDVVVGEGGVTNSKGAVASYTFTNVMANGSITASFVADAGGPPASWLTDTGVDSGDLDNDLRGDGLTPRQAWVASTDPTNTAFSFRVTSVDKVDGTNFIEWVSVFVDTNLPPFGIWARTNLMDTTYDLIDTYPRVEGASPSTPVTNIWSEAAPAYPIYYRVVATNTPSGP